mmetsp:Transcript_18775/g.37400  ORF Transcript_18775/g.37400 Transcript_18775/m.37400 type:complete len:227 (-) Transcript_18775:2385-3065(-)
MFAPIRRSLNLDPRCCTSGAHLHRVGECCRTPFLQSQPQLSPVSLTFSLVPSVARGPHEDPLPSLFTICRGEPLVELRKQLLLWHTDTLTARTSIQRLHSRERTLHTCGSPGSSRHFANARSSACLLHDSWASSVRLGHVRSCPSLPLSTPPVRSGTRRPVRRGAVFATTRVRRPRSTDERSVATPLLPDCARAAGPAELPSARVCAHTSPRYCGGRRRSPPAGNT